jgi:hypothetical protein
MSLSIRILIAVFLIAHAFIHASLSWVPLPKPGEMRTPFFPSWQRADVDPLWPIMKTGLPASAVRTIGWVLWVAVTVTGLLSAFGLAGLPGLSAIWQPCAGISAVLSIILIAAFWHPWLPVGILIDLVVLASLLLRIPSSLYK